MTSICPECDEMVEDGDFHPLCCPHAEVEDDDGRDGVGGRRIWWCHDCQEEVIAVPNEDGGIDWEVRFA